MAWNVYKQQVNVCAEYVGWDRLRQEKPSIYSFRIIWYFVHLCYCGMWSYDAARNNSSCFPFNSDEEGFYLPSILLSKVIIIKKTKITAFFRIKEFSEFGLVNKWFNNYKTYVLSRREYRCNSTSNAYSRHGFLTLTQMQGAFWVLLIGLGLAIVYLVVEFILRFRNTVVRVTIRNF